MDENSEPVTLDLTRYKEIKHVAGPALSAVVQKTGGKSPLTRLEDGKNDELNGLLAIGWEIVRIITHTSRENDATGIMYIVGLPKKGER